MISMMLIAPTPTMNPKLGPYKVKLFITKGHKCLSLKLKKQQLHVGCLLSNKEIGGSP
jgi:hypothetical protein